MVLVFPAAVYFRLTWSVCFPFILFCCLLASDIIIGGQPGVECSGVRANRQDVRELQSRRLTQFGNLIERHELQEGNPLFVLCETVLLPDKHEVLFVENMALLVSVAFSLMRNTFRRADETGVRHHCKYVVDSRSPVLNEFWQTISHPYSLFCGF